jgi:predicted nucleotidyltransferase
VIERLAGAGAEAAVIGSLARGRFRAHSDVAFLVLDPGPLTDGEIIGIVETAARLPLRRGVRRPLSGDRLEDHRGGHRA